MWTATVEADRDPVTGKRRRVVVRAKTKTAAMTKVNQACQSIASGVRADPGLTVGRFLTDWLKVVVAG
jgi:hypothetical protein